MKFPTIAIVSFALLGSLPGRTYCQTDTTRQAPSGTAKDPFLAGFASFMIPGLGQVYADRPLAGGAFLAFSIAGFAVATSYGSQIETCRSTSPASCETDNQRFKKWATIGAMTWIGAWLGSTITAPGDVHDWNRAHGFEPVVTSGAMGTTRVGVLFRLR